ncbi:MAG: FHA domain-containing protein [Chromatiales bacterium]|nr:FHA domain-containing protein [Chromatiales bacterium]
MARLLLSLDDQTLAEYNMTRERYTIGRLADNDIRIDSPTISGHHALIINILNDSFLEDLSSTNGTYVNGQLIRKHALQHGDVITVGRHELRFVDSALEEPQDSFAATMVLNQSDRVAGPESAAPAAAQGRTSASVQPLRTKPSPAAPARIQVLSGGHAGQELDLTKALTTLGRPGSQVIAVSRRQDGYHLVQLENTLEYPVTINGEPVGMAAIRLRQNDVIELLGVKLGFFSA